MKKFSEKNLERKLKHLDLLEQSLSTFRELRSNWSQWSDKEKLEFLIKRQEEIRKKLEEE